MKRGFVFKEIQIETTTRCRITLIGMWRPQRWTKASVGEDVEKLEPSYIVAWL